MEIVKVKMTKELLQILIDSGALSFEDIQIETIETIGIDYSSDTIWQSANKTSKQAYKRLKGIEYELRQRCKCGKMKLQCECENDFF